jgi:hypothetical protein
MSEIQKTTQDLNYNPTEEAQITALLEQSWTIRPGWKTDNFLSLSWNETLGIHPTA